ncbi:MAG: glycoside hydrolase family 15 protein [Clostridia bacterium]|nr:glycoside hydrolase family 15 protein [Clostridia bacterium]
MTKPYINNAVVGNSSMLGCITDKGELIRLFWPNIDYPQHIDRLAVGVFFTEHRHSTLWLHEDNFHHEQYYVKDTNILKTICTDYGRGIKIEQTDFVLPEKDVMIRNLTIGNYSEHEYDLGVIVYSSGISTNPEMRNTLFDFSYDALIHYRHGYYISISSNMKAYQFQLGNNAYDSARYTELNGNDSIGMMPDGAVSWKLGRIMPGEKRQFTLHVCASDTLKNLKKVVHSMNNSDIIQEYENTEEYWLDFLNKAQKVHTSDIDVNNLYKRTLLVFKLMSDKKTGGLLAAPEIDEGFTRCGRYAYCWGRDAAFITGALDKCGLTSSVEKFYEWAVQVQDDEGSWQQRYHMDGNIAPSWGLQIDETGTIIWGMLKHYEMTGSKEFLEGVWESVEKAADFLVNFVDEDTGLPKPSYDLWEERFGEHTYSSAAVCGGIKAAVEIAGVLGRGQDKVPIWEKAWMGMKAAMEKHLWKEDRRCFLRSIRTKLNPWGGEYSQDTTVIEVNPKGYKRDVTLEDGMIDISLLGISIPFGVFESDDYRVACTVENIERALTSPVIGGIKRYESDNYAGGNPWVLTTLWVALYYCSRRDFAKAKSYFYWAVKSRTELGLLPEQVNRDTGRPEWVIPLTWSHAMFVLVLMELLDAGEV